MNVTEYVCAKLKHIEISLYLSQALEYVYKWNYVHKSD